MRRIIGALTMLLAVLGLVATTAAGGPGQNPKPTMTYTPAPAWSWPYGESAEVVTEPPSLPEADKEEDRVGSLCKDGTWSKATGRGACSHHGGVAAQAVTSDFTWPTPTTTPVNKRVIEVVDRVGPAKWNVRQAMDWLDHYTTSDMRLVARCSGHAWRCVVVRGGKLPGSYLGLTEGNSITIDTAKVNRRGYRSNLRREQILAHELFHTYGYGHSGSGRNLMRPKMSQIKLTLTAGQRRYLAAR